MRTLVQMLMIGVCLCGCDRRVDEPLEAFEQRWHDAINRREADQLFQLLDAESRGRIRHDLEKMRGLSETAQQAVINQLGGIRADNLHQLLPEQYFGRMWNIATDGKRPTMVLEASGPNAAYMILTLGRERTLRVRLVREAGTWVWQLPTEALQWDRTPDDAGTAEGE